MDRKLSSITRLAVRGFKSIGDWQEIEIRPLTILAGANSSGKSSIMQPLLLLKQTLEAPVDPGALLLDGPNVRFTMVEQMLSRVGGRSAAEGLAVRLERACSETLELRYQPASQGRGMDVTQQTHRWSASGEVLEDLSPTRGDSSKDALPPERLDMIATAAGVDRSSIGQRVVRDRCFLKVVLVDRTRGDERRSSTLPASVFTGMAFMPQLQSVIHVPGLRGNPSRTYARTATGPNYAGSFEAYVASLIARWQEEKRDALHELARRMEDLGLTWKIKADAIDDTRVEVRVGRLPKGRRGGAHDLVNIADVGFGVSQSLPVLVALIAAEPGQLVYLEQPEIHLHPKAQRRLAHALCWAAKRDVRLVVETHSALLLREVQTLVARGEMPEDDVRLHWFARDDDGATQIRTAELDESGAYGDWPEDFSDTELAAERAYLDAVEQRSVQQ